MVMCEPWGAVRIEEEKGPRKHRPIASPLLPLAAALET